MPNRDLTPSSGARSLSPFGEDPFSSFRRQFDRLFDDFFAPAEPRSFASLGVAHPSIELHETDKAFEVTAELPGLDEKDVQLELRDNVLTISGEKRAERQEEEGGRHWSERTFGRFTRTIPLDGEVDPEKVQAAFKKGLLTITLPKNPRAQEKTRRIEIKPQ